MHGSHMCGLTCMMRFVALACVADIPGASIQARQFVKDLYRMLEKTVLKQKGRCMAHCQTITLAISTRTAMSAVATTTSC